MLRYTVVLFVGHIDLGRKSWTKYYSRSDSRHFRFNKPIIVREAQFLHSDGGIYNLTADGKCAPRSHLHLALFWEPIITNGDSRSWDR